MSALMLSAALMSGCGSDSRSAGDGGVARLESEGSCMVCHASTIDTKANSGMSVVAEFATSLHNPANSTHATGCQGCHGGGSQHNGSGPFPYPNPLAADRCMECHGPAIYNGYKNFSSLFRVAKTGGFATKCAPCHTVSRIGSIHAAKAPADTLGCVDCHAVAAPKHGAGGVGDNDGVRAVVQEFNKWSHHVTGVNLNDAHCAACHLEGRVSGDAIIVDSTYHMADNKTHLRNADTDADIQWNPAAPSFTDMDTFCLTCHDANGATSQMSVRIQTVINAYNTAQGYAFVASATNPFGDSISNQYDKLSRPAVVDAKGQFATGNNSHHAVLGKKYSGRTRTAGAARAITSPATFAANSSATMPGVRSTIYDAGKFEATYTTLADAAGESGTRNGGTTLGDDSTLHCGDCHTVGQFKPTATTSPEYRYNKVAIGAHGSNNEYMLRNNLGTDEKHTGAKFAGSGNFGSDLGYGNMPYLVCFNCHAFATYGSAFGTSGAGHAAEYDQDGRCNGAAQTINNVYGPVTGLDRLKTYNADITKYGTTDGNTFGNVFGIQCNNCHNSGVSANNIFGGIHGSKTQTYTDGMGNTSKHFRFLPGLGNSMFVPGTKGGFTGGGLATFTVYSGNRDGTGTGNTTGQTYTTLPVRTIVANSGANGSYQYVTGGTSNDLNWEQKSQQPVAGQTDVQAKAMGCYTLSPTGAVASNGTGRNGDPDRLAATNNQQAGRPGPDGTNVMFDNWGGCDDHNGAQGGGTNFTRKVLRKTSY
jgi:hypothetical protein